MDVSACVGQKVVDDDDDDAAYAALPVLVLPLKWTVTYTYKRYDGISRPKYLEDFWHKGLDKVLGKEKRKELDHWWQKENQGVTFDDDISLEDVEVLGDPVKSALTVLDPMPMDPDEPVDDPTKIPRANAPGSLVPRYFLIPPNSALGKWLDRLPKAALEPDSSEKVELNRLLDDHLKYVKRRWPETFLKLLHKLRIDIVSYEQFEQDLKHEADRQFEWRSQNCRELFEEEAERRRSEAVKYLDNVVKTPAVPKKWPTKEKLEEEERMIEDSVENLPEAEAKTRRIIGWSWIRSTGGRRTC